MKQGKPKYTSTRAPDTTRYDRLRVLKVKDKKNRVYNTLGSPANVAAH